MGRDWWWVIVDMRSSGNYPRRVILGGSCGIHLMRVMECVFRNASVY